MQDYEMYNNNIKQGVISIFWDNINNNYKDTIIDSKKNNKYKVVSFDDSQKYELSFIIDNIDDIYDIVSKYITKDKERFNEIDKIKEYNKIKTIKKSQIIKIIIPATFLKYFNKTLKNIDKNSLINSKIYFIKKVSEKNNLTEIKNRLNKIIDYFNNIINSNEYAFYDDSEKENFANNAIDKLNKLINDIEFNSEYRYGKDFLVNIKIN